MRIDIWSDVRCPFCYIGKHKFEKALEKFPHKEEVNVVWYSFQLDPNIKTNPEMSDAEYLAKAKGLSKAQVNQMLKGAEEMGKEMGLNFNFDQTKVANSLNAHRLIQLAKAKNLANETEEALFKSHFEEGKNIDDKMTLKEIGKSVGLKEEDLDRMLFTDEYKEQVEDDQLHAGEIGVRGVPFFVFVKKYDVSGALPVEAFLAVLHKTWEEYKGKENPNIIVNEGKSCDTSGNCDD